jgi:ribosome-binding factor A
LGEATIRYSVLGDESDRREVAADLARVVGFLQRHVGDELRLRQTPHLRFAFDDSILESLRLESLFDQIAHEHKDDDKKPSE